MSAGKSEVVAWMYEDHAPWMKEPAAGFTLDKDHLLSSSGIPEGRISFVALVPESLLLDARAEVERLARLELRARTDCESWYERYEWLRQRAERAEALAASNQAKIDALMLEYCPDEMTQAQRDEWARHQAPDDNAIDAVGGRGER